MSPSSCGALLLFYCTNLYWNSFSNIDNDNHPSLDGFLQVDVFENIET